jgi:exopolyphosphatase/guanosine-5'-triphosphate,3'-diphosphate pyrophosphatase
MTAPARRAFIDIGSGTLLLLVVEPDPTAGRGGLRPLVDLCRFGRLGQGLAATGQLAPAAIARSLDACREFRAAMDEVGVASIEVIATQAVREARNAAEFVEPASALLGAPITTISGAREAELAARAVAATFPELAGTTYVVVDIGGASTELVVTDGRHVTSAVSVPIGAGCPRARRSSRRPARPRPWRRSIWRWRRTIPIA